MVHRECEPHYRSKQLLTFQPHLCPPLSAVLHFRRRAVGSCRSRVQAPGNFNLKEKNQLHKTATITAVIVGASALLADLIFSVNTFFRHKKMLTKLCDENAELLTANTHLKAEAALARSSESKIIVRALGLEQELETVRAANLIFSRDLDAAREEIKQLKLKLADTKDKLKSAHDHISVLRAEIVKLNRQLNQTKRRG